MAYDLEEQEKIDALKAWWDRYGTISVVLVFLLAASVAGWRGWQWYESHQATQAMGYYEALETASQQNGAEAVERVKAASTQLRNDFPGSAYTPRAVLLAASVFELHGDLPAAQEQLEWLLKSKQSQDMQALARLRLAGVLLSMQQYAEAERQLQAPVPAGFAALYQDRLGDIYAAQGKTPEALQYWGDALQSFGDGAAAQIVQLKMDALKGA